jgi:hypothetical protein
MSAPQGCPIARPLASSGDYGRPPFCLRISQVSDATSWLYAMCVSSAGGAR